MSFIVFAGVLILIPNLNLSSDIGQGVLWGLVSAMAFSIRNMISRKYIIDYSAETLIFYQCLVSAILLLPLIFIFETAFTENHVLQLLPIGSDFYRPSTYFILLEGLLILKAKTISIIAAFLPIYGTILAAFLLGEIPSMRTIIGGCIILSVIVFEIIQNLRS